MSRRAEVEQRKAVQALRDAAEARLLGEPRPALVAVVGEEPMVCDEREVAYGAIEHSGH